MVWTDDFGSIVQIIDMDWPEWVPGWFQGLFESNDTASVDDPFEKEAWVDPFPDYRAESPVEEF